MGSSPQRQRCKSRSKNYLLLLVYFSCCREALRCLTISLVTVYIKCTRWHTWAACCTDIFSHRDCDRTKYNGVDNEVCLKSKNCLWAWVLNLHEVNLHSLPSCALEKQDSFTFISCHLIWPAATCEAPGISLETNDSELLNNLKSLVIFHVFKT